MIGNGPHLGGLRDRQVDGRLHRRLVAALANVVNDADDRVERTRIAAELHAMAEWRLARDDLIPEGDGVLVPASELPDAKAGDIVRYAPGGSGTERRGRIVGLI